MWGAWAWYRNLGENGYGAGVYLSIVMHGSAAFEPVRTLPDGGTQLRVRQTRRALSDRTAEMRLFAADWLTGWTDPQWISERALAARLTIRTFECRVAKSLLISDDVRVTGELRVLSVYEGFFTGGARILHSGVIAALHGGPARRTRS